MLRDHANRTRCDFLAGELALRCSGAWLRATTGASSGHQNKQRAKYQVQTIVPKLPSSLLTPPETPGDLIYLPPIKPAIKPPHPHEPGIA